MNSVDKKNLVTAIKDIETNKQKIKEKHINYLLQIINDLKLQDKIIKAIK